MLIAARVGATAYTLRNTLIALVSAWTAGAEVLALEVRLTRDGEIVVAADPTTDRLTERSPNRAVRHEPFVDLLDDLPPQVPLLAVVADDSGRGAELTQWVVAVLPPGTVCPTVSWSALIPHSSRPCVSMARPVSAWMEVGRTPAEQRDLLDSSGADALLTGAHQVFDGQGGLTEWGQALAARHDSGQLTVGVVLRADSGVPPADLMTAAAGPTFVWACLTDSMLALDSRRPRGPIATHRPGPGPVLRPARLPAVRGGGA